VPMLPHSYTEQPMILSSARPPLSAKVVSKIQSGQYVSMKDILSDNMSLCTQLEALPGLGPGTNCSNIHPNFFSFFPTFLP